MIIYDHTFIIIRIRNYILVQWSTLLELMLSCLFIIYAIGDYRINAFINSWNHWWNLSVYHACSSFMHEQKVLLKYYHVADQKVVSFLFNKTYWSTPFIMQPNSFSWSFELFQNKWGPAKDHIKNVLFVVHAVLQPEETSDTTCLVTSDHDVHRKL